MKKTFLFGGRMVTTGGASRFPVVSKERRTVDGVTFDSQKEARRYSELCLLEKAGQISELEIQPLFRVAINGQPYCKFTPDFLYREGGKIVAEDVKSSGTAKDPAYRLRLKAARLAYPHVQFVELLR